MRTAFAAIISLTICLIAAGCYAQSSSSVQSVGGDFGRDWISSFKAQNPQPAETNLKNDLWSWGSSPKGSIVVNGNLLPDPYYIWKSLNYTSGWLGRVYVDPITGYTVYGYIDPYTGMPIYYYLDPKTRRPVYTNAYPTFGFPYNNNIPPYYFPPYYSQDYLPVGYLLPAI
jgi:hypothetical protein